MRLPVEWIVTKAQRILELHGAGMSDKEIAAKVGCHPSYVRVVARQRKGRSMSEYDIRWRNENRERFNEAMRMGRRRREGKSS